MSRIILFGVFLIVSIFAISCQNLEDSTGECYEYDACDAGSTCEAGMCVESTYIKANTIFITSKEIENELLPSKNDDLVFFKNDRTIKFKKNDIIAFGESEEYAGGYVAKIVSVNIGDDSVIVKTEVVDPLKAFKHFRIDTRKILNSNVNSELFRDLPKEEIDKFYDVVHHRKMVNKTFQKDTYGPYSIEWEPRDDITDPNQEVKKATLSLEVAFSNALELIIDIREHDGSGTFIDDYFLDEFKIKNTMGLDFKATLNLALKSFSASPLRIKKLKEALDAGDLKIGSFTVTLPPGIPLTLELAFGLALEPKVSLQGSAEFIFENKNDLVLGAHYKKGNSPETLNLSSASATTTLDAKVNFSGEASLTLKMSPKLIVYAARLKKVFNIVGSMDFDFTIAKATATQSSSISSSGNHSLESCFTLGGGFEIKPNIEFNFAEGTRWKKKFTFSPSGPLYEKTWSWLKMLGVANMRGDKKCYVVECATDSECRTSNKTMDATCGSDHTCKYEPKVTDYDMADIAGGTFNRGCVSGDSSCQNSEEPVKSVKINAFKIGKKEVTNSQYKACVTAGKCHPPVGGYLTSGPNQPVTNIRWTDAANFCSWKGNYRLPTEAEWEFAAKGTSNKKYPWGDEDPTCEKTMMEGLKYLDSDNKPTSDPNNDADGNPQNTPNLKYGNGCHTGEPADVGTYPEDKSPYGVMDMAGNVREWVRDYYNAYYYSDSSSLDNPQGSSALTNNLISVRGGGFMTNRISTFRNSNRGNHSYFSIDPEIGFRCAASK